VAKSKVVCRRNYSNIHPERRDWAIAYKKGEQVLVVKSGQVQINKVTLEISQDLENANSKLDKALDNNVQTRTGELQR
jgi:hypothetical protein